MKHAVDQRRTLHDVAHEDKQRNRQQGVIRHHPVRPLHHKIEDPTLPPVMRRIPESDVTKDHAEAHECKCRGKTHHDRNHNEPQHGQAEYWIAHGLFRSSSLIALSCTTPSSITLRWRAASSMACAVSIAAQARLFVHVLAVGELGLDNVNFFHIVQARRPGASANANNTADDFSEALKHDKCSCDRNDCFEVVDRRTLCRHIRMLRDAPGIGGVAVARIDKPEDAWDKKQKIQGEIECRPGRAV